MDLGVGNGLLGTGGSSQPATLLNITVTPENAQANELVTIEVQTNSTSVTFTSDDVSLQGTGLIRTFNAPSLFEDNTVFVRIRALDVNEDKFIIRDVIVNVSARPPNTIPSAIITAPSTSKVGERVNVSIATEDLDGDQVTVTTRVIGRSDISLSSNTSKQFSFVVPESASGETITIGVTPNDGTQNGSEVTFSIEIDSTSSLNLRLVGIPDSSYNVDFYDSETKEYLTSSNLPFTNGRSNVKLESIPTGSLVEYRVKTETHYAGDEGVTF